MTGLGEASAGRLETLYTTHAPGALRLAYLMTGERALAEDLVQEAFARVIGRLGHVRDPRSFDAYVRRAVVNLSKNHFRRRAIERAHAARAGSEPHRVAAEPDIAERERLREALLRLPERQRAAVALRFYEDRSEGDIAAILDCAGGTVRSLIARGMATLRADLGGDDDA